MMAEFEANQSAHDGGFWDAENFVYEEWLESNQNHEMGINLPEGWVPDIQLVAFSRDGQAVGLSLIHILPYVADYKAYIQEFLEQSRSDEVLFVTGSLYFIAEVRAFLLEA